MIPLIETLEINLRLKFLIDATMKSFRDFRRGRITRLHSASSASGGALHFAGRCGDGTAIKNWGAVPNSSRRKPESAADNKNRSSKRKPLRSGIRLMPRRYYPKCMTAKDKFTEGWETQSNGRNLICFAPNLS